MRSLCDALATFRLPAASALIAPALLMKALRVLLRRILPSVNLTWLFHGAHYKSASGGDDIKSDDVVANLLSASPSHPFEEGGESEVLIARSSRLTLAWEAQR